MTEQRIREAMERLLAGQAMHSDGRLSVANLAREAQVPRTSMCRKHPAVVQEFEQRSAALAQGDERPVSVVLAKMRQERDEWMRKARDYREQRQTSDRRVRALENQVRLLDEQARRLEAELARVGIVSQLRAEAGRG